VEVALLAELRSGMAQASDLGVAPEQLVEGSFEMMSPR
jgi:hypothetical protein